MIKCVLTIAGADPTGGGGIQADIKSFSALDVYGLSVLTALTVQDPSGVKEIYPVPNYFVAFQMEALVKAFDVKALKIGMVYQGAIIKEIVRLIKFYRLKNVVVDPIIRAGSGDRLLQDGALEVLKQELIPHADIVTPNTEEAGELIGKEVYDMSSMQDAAYQIYKMGAAHVLVKGGHLKGEIKDLFFDGRQYRIMEMTKGPENVRGTGCTLSAAIAAFLAKGLPVDEAVSKAQGYTQKVIHRAIDFGKGVLYPKHSMIRIRG